MCLFGGKMNEHFCFSLLTEHLRLETPMNSVFCIEYSSVIPPFSIGWIFFIKLLVRLGFESQFSNFVIEIEKSFLSL